jgi:hypothetical protein
MSAALALLSYVLLEKTPIVLIRDVYIYYNLVAALERTLAITTLLSRTSSITVAGYRLGYRPQGASYMKPVVSISVRYHPHVPGAPLNGPTISCVIQPP